MSRRLISDLRNLVQDCETIAVAGRKALAEIESAQLLGTAVDEDAVERAVKKLERRLTQAARRVGVTGR